MTAEERATACGRIVSAPDFVSGYDLNELSTFCSIAFIREYLLEMPSYLSRPLTVLGLLLLSHAYETPEVPYTLAGANVKSHFIDATQPTNIPPFLLQLLKLRA